jgi:hypothetical protein
MKVYLISCNVIDKGTMLLQNCMDILKVEPGSSSRTFHRYPELCMVFIICVSASDISISLNGFFRVLQKVSLRGSYVVAHCLCTTRSSLLDVFLIYFDMTPKCHNLEIREK